VAVSNGIGDSVQLVLVILRGHKHREGGISKSTEDRGRWTGIDGDEGAIRSIAIHELLIGRWQALGNSDG